MSVATRITVVLVALLVGAAATAGVFFQQGYRLFAITSGSMVPALEVGDLAVAEPPGDAYAIGDVITFNSGGGRLTTHRITEIDEGVMETRGDANVTPDIFLQDAGNVVGRVVTMVPNGGYVLVFFRQPTGILALVLALVSMALLWDLCFATSVRGPNLR
jgi:signal peptidase